MSSYYQRNYHINLLEKHLVFNTEEYTLKVSPNEYSYHNVNLRFNHKVTFSSTLLTVVFDMDKYYITFGSSSDILKISDIFKTANNQNLHSLVLDKIKDITNQHQFINYFMFGDKKCTITNNYDTVEHLIETPQDLLGFSKELKPFMPPDCLSSAIKVIPLLKPDFSGIIFDYNLRSHIDHDIYSDIPEKVWANLLTKYVCGPLNKDLHELTLRDHVLLKMVKI